METNNTSAVATTTNKSFANTSKNVAKKAGVIVVQSITTPLHIATQLGANILQTGADYIALGEGRVLEPLTGIDREELANKRVEYTQARFLQTAMALDAFNQKTKAVIAKGDDIVRSGMDKVKHALAPANPETIEVKSPEVVPQVKQFTYEQSEVVNAIRAKREQLRAARANRELSNNDRIWLCSDLQTEIAQLSDVADFLFGRTSSIMMPAM